MRHMASKKLSLYYKVTTKEVIPPSQTDIERKEQWVDNVKSSVEADWKPKMIKVTYEDFDPEIEDQRKFFHIAVKWYAIQNEDMVDNVPSSALVKKYRDELLDDMLGYDVEMVTRTKRERKSTTEFKTVQKWHNFLRTLEETKFEPAGYEFPNSEEFWELAKKYSYEKANEITTKNLQKKIRAKLSDE